MNSSMEQNIQLFPRYKATNSVLPYLPVFFLFFLERVSLGEAVLLGSVYYFSVFALEVPSGYYSDRFGRRPTLIIASISKVLACVVFIVADSFNGLLIGQLLLAGGMAFQSGSDSALLYDSLRVLEREDEYSARESAAQKWSMNALACSCLIGGGLGVIDLRLPYVVALIASIITVVQSISFIEPPIEEGATASGFFTQLKDVGRYFFHPLLGWILGFYMLGYSLEHIPYEFYQPYLKLLGESGLSSWLTGPSTPFYSGLIISVSMFGGAVGASLSQQLVRRVGLRLLLLISLVVQLIIIGGLSLILHPVMLLLVMFRNFSMSMAHGPMLGAIAPHVSSAQRATFLSMLSLFGRATLALYLSLLSVFVVGIEGLSWEALSTVLLLSTIVGVTGLIFLYLRSARVKNQL